MTLSVRETKELICCVDKAAAAQHQAPQRTVQLARAGAALRATGSREVLWPGWRLARMGESLEVAMIRYD